MRYLHNGNVCPLLPGLAEDVALPALGMKFVSNESPAGMAPFRSPGLEDWYCKAGRLYAGKLGLLPVAPVSRVFGGYNLAPTVRLDRNASLML